MSKEDPTYFMTPMFRAAFAHVFTPNAPKGADKKSYSIAMLFKKGENLTVIQKAIDAAAKEKWGDKIPKKFKHPIIKEQDELAEQYEGFTEGAFFIQASNQMQPGLVDKDRNEIIDEQEFYSGCFARATVRAYAWDNAFGKGVSLSLQNVQKLKDGERLGGGQRIAPEEDFEDAEEENYDDL